VLAEFALVDRTAPAASSHASEVSEVVSTGVGAAAGAAKLPGRAGATPDWRRYRRAGAGACARAMAHASSSAPASAYVRFVSVVFIVE
jgi:hypothetical protein